MTRIDRPGLAATLILALLADPGVRAASVGDCARLVLGDPLSNAGGPQGSAFDIDPALPVDSNSTVLGGVGAAFLSSVAIGAGRDVFLTDLEADPNGLGGDPNGNAGRGAVFLLDPPTGALLTVADGTACGVGIANCGPQGVFVDPIGIAWSDELSMLAVVDLDSDPTGLGPDSQGYNGHGAIFTVDPGTGTLALVADGSDYPAGLPPGRPSIFEDPIAIDFARDGRLFVLDQLARPVQSVGAGAVFEVDVATGAVTLVSNPQILRGPRDLAVEPGGTILVLDNLAGTTGAGAILRIDPVLPPNANVVAVFAPPEFVDATGIVVEGNGTIRVTDASADPLALGRSGAVFVIDPVLGTARPESSTADYAAPWAVALVEPESVDSAFPASAPAGTSLTIRLVGGIFDPTPVVDLGAGVTVDLVTWVSATELDVAITIAPGAAPGPRDAAVTNANRSMAFHCELFEVLPPIACAPTQPVGDTLRVTKSPPGDVRLDWGVVADPCLTDYRVRRAFGARPVAPPGIWPVDPAFADISSEDHDGLSTDPTFTGTPIAGTTEYFLITTINSVGDEGPVEHYGG